MGEFFKSIPLDACSWSHPGLQTQSVWGQDPEAAIVHLKLDWCSSDTLAVKKQQTCTWQILAICKVCIQLTRYGFSLKVYSAGNKRSMKCSSACKLNTITEPTIVYSCIRRLVMFNVC